MTDGFITITEERYNRMAKAELFLSMLEAHGVSNWEWYDIAYIDYFHLVEDCPDVNG